jgi:DNA-binding GntR family transcriptional regulator
MKLELTLDRHSPVPLYYQLSQVLERAIASGELKPGDKIDTEVEISEKYGLSRPTVRQAIQALVNKGMLVRRRGVGTQVVHAQVRRQVELTSLYDDLARSNHHPKTSVVQLKVQGADDVAANALGMTAGDDVLFLERVRFDGDEPLAHMTNWLPSDLLDVTAADLEEHGLYELLRRVGVQMRVANQRIGAKAATPREAKLLEVRRGAPLLTMERTAFDVTGRPVEYALHAYRADSYAFETTLVER